MRVRRLGRNRAGEIRLFRFLHNPAVSVAEMVATAAARTRRGIVGRHVLAIQDTTSVRAGADGRCMALHPVIAVDAIDGTLLGLVDARFFLREGGKRGQRRERDFTEKESRRWLDGAECSADLVASGAVLVTVVADREGDIYEDFACKPRGVEMLIRAGQDRSLADGSHLFAKAEMAAEAGRMTVDLPAAPGRSARLRFCLCASARCKSRVRKVGHAPERLCCRKVSR